MLCRSFLSLATIDTYVLQGYLLMYMHPVEKTRAKHLSASLLPKVDQSGKLPCFCSLSRVRRPLMVIRMVVNTARSNVKDSHA